MAKINYTKKEIIDDDFYLYDEITNKRLYNMLNKTNLSTKEMDNIFLDCCPIYIVGGD